MEIGHGLAQCGSTQTSVYNLSIEERLQQRKSALERELKGVTEALEALQANPEVLKIMSLISKVSY